MTHIIQVYYKYPNTLLFGTYQHKCFLIALIKALWATRVGWRFFSFKHNVHYNISFAEFHDEIMNFVDRKPKEWRKGQAVFNYINNNYHVARQVLFEDGIDCFHNDDLIEQFILESYKKICGVL